MVVRNINLLNLVRAYGKLLRLEGQFFFLILALKDV